MCSEGWWKNFQVKYFKFYQFRYFATAGADRKIKIWEISKGINVDLKATLTGSNAAVMGIDFDTTGQNLEAIKTNIDCSVFMQEA